MIAVGLLIPLGVAAGDKANEVRESVKAKEASETNRPAILSTSKPKHPAEETKLGKGYTAQAKYAEDIAKKYGYTDIIESLKKVLNEREALIEKAVAARGSKSMLDRRVEFEEKHRDRLAELDAKVADKKMSRAEADNARRALFNSYMGFQGQDNFSGNESKKVYAQLKKVVAEANQASILQSLKDVVKAEQALNDELARRAGK